MTERTIAERIFEALAEHPYGLSVRQITEIVYPDPDKEPDYSYDCIYMAIRKANKRWRQNGSWLSIRSRGRRYRLFIQRPTMKIRYQLQVRAQCPVNPEDTDLYDFEIISDEIIEVERIRGFFSSKATQHKIFQEALTQACAVALGVKVTSVGWHSGVKVICEAP